MIEVAILSQRLNELSKFGDPLERLSQTVDFEIFRGSLESCFGFEKTRKGGRPHYDAVLIFKILILQSLYNLSDDQMEYQIKDRISFMRFLSLGVTSQVPDAKTIWLYRERLTVKGMMAPLFLLFDDQLRGQGYLAMGGQIVDASIIKAPRQRMKDEEKSQVKSGEIPSAWPPAKRAQKDCHARWVVKHSKAKRQGIDMAIPYFGYKSLISIDRAFGFIRNFLVTPASAHDGKQLSNLIDRNNTASTIWGDTAYASTANLTFLSQNLFYFQLNRKKPQTKASRRANHKRSKIRAKVEHVFAVQKHHMNIFIRTIGQVRAHAKMALFNITYNMKRLTYWQRVNYAL